MPTHQESKFDYHIVQTNDRLKSIEHKLDTLISFRAMILGASAGLSLIVTVLFNIAVFLFK